MTDKKFILPGPETVTIASSTVDKLIRAGDGAAALLYLYILKSHGQMSVDEAAGYLSKPKYEIEAAMSLLARIGLIRSNDEESVPVPQEPVREYSAEEVSRELENGAVFKSLVTETQNSLGKVLSSDDLVRLFGIYDGLGLPPEVILQLITHCISENRRKYGAGRLPTLRYIEKAAYTWQREGLFTLELAEVYLKELDIRKSETFEVKKVLQIRDRQLSATEEKYVSSWLALGFGRDAVELAYDRTIIKTGKLAWGYMDSILKSWHSKGIHTKEEIMKKDGSSAAPSKQNKSHEHSAPNTADIERMKKLLEKIKEE